MVLASVLLVLFVAVASADGLYFHLYRYRLHAHAASRLEHLLHTANTCLFVPQVVLLFCLRARGPLLLLAAAISLATVGIELADVACERASRRELGGLATSEYALHFLMSGLRMGFVAACFATMKAADLLAPAALAPAPPEVAVVGWCMAVPGLGIAALHVALATRRAPAG